MKPFKLEADYSNKYGGINGYDAPDERGRGARKEQFLAQGATLLRRVAREFEAEGWKSRIITNRAGVAVSGEVTLKLNKAGIGQSLSVQLSGSVLLGRPSDGAVIMAQIRNEDMRFVGGNIYLSADVDSDELFVQLWQIAKRLA